MSAVAALSADREEHRPVILLGVDPHKSTHTATAVEPESNQQLGTMRIEASLTDYRRLLAWAKRWPQRKWAVENANGLGRHLAQWLIARGESVVDVPAAATSRVRLTFSGLSGVGTCMQTCASPLSPHRTFGEHLKPARQSRRRARESQDPRQKSFIGPAGSRRP
ncbi:transposase [Streptomyces sp. NPDC001312]|uniref:IS110 family transposase n=1 Tax=Streptomyces sp. NPDC001312 TaxID=3364561 RepID=UPI0036C14F5A